MKSLLTPVLCASLIFLLTFGASSTASNDDRVLSDREAYLLLDNLLELSEATTDHDVQLARYREWEKLHIKLSPERNMTKNQMKVYLFMVFIAHEDVKIHSQEEMAEEILPLFSRQSTLMLTVLKELSFLIRRTCGSINDSFDLYGTPDDRQEFIKKYETDITRVLGKERAAICMSELKGS
jgi:hypothetical protein